MANPFLIFIQQFFSTGVISGKGALLWRINLSPFKKLEAN